MSTIVAAAVCVWLFGATVRHYFASAADPGVIRFAHFGTYQDYETWGCVIEAFERENPGLSVAQEYVVGWYGLYNAKLRQQMLAGTMPHVALVQIGPFAAMADKFADLTPLIESAEERLDLTAFDETAVAMFRFSGRMRAIPVSGGNLLIYCNPDCFERASVFHDRRLELPRDNWTIDDFRQLAQDLTCDFDGDGTIDQFGFWQPRWVYYLPFIWSFGADVLNESLTTWTLTGPEALAAFAFYQRMRIGDRVSDDIGDRISPHPHEVSQIIQDVGFLTGKTAMCVNGPWFQPFLAETKLADTYRVAHIPTGPAGRATRVTWDGITMADDLEPRAAQQAWRFMRFVSSNAGQRILAGTQRALPARRSALTAFDDGGSDPRAHRFVEALAYSRTQPRTPHFSDVDRAINHHLRRLLDPSNPLPPSDFLTALAGDQRITQHFDRLGATR